MFYLVGLVPTYCTVSAVQIINPQYCCYHWPFNLIEILQSEATEVVAGRQEEGKDKES